MNFDIQIYLAMHVSDVMLLPILQYNLEQMYSNYEFLDLFQLFLNK